MSKNILTLYLGFVLFVLVLSNNSLRLIPFKIKVFVYIIYVCVLCIFIMCMQGSRLILPTGRAFMTNFLSLSHEHIIWLQFCIFYIYNIWLIHACWWTSRFKIQETLLSYQLTFPCNGTKLGLRSRFKKQNKKELVIRYMLTIYVNIST